METKTGNKGKFLTFNIVHSSFSHWSLPSKGNRPITAQYLSLLYCTIRAQLFIVTPVLNTYLLTWLIYNFTLWYLDSDYGKDYISGKSNYSQVHLPLSHHDASQPDEAALPDDLPDDLPVTSLPKLPGTRSTLSHDAPEPEAAGPLAPSSSGKICKVGPRVDWWVAGRR